MIISPEQRIDEEALYALWLHTTATYIRYHHHIEDREDASNQGFMNFLIAVRSGQVREPANYAYGVARNTFNEAARHGITTRALFSPQDASGYRTALSPGADPEELAALAAIRIMMRDVIGAMKNRDLAGMVQRAYIDEVPSRLIGEQTGLTHTQVRLLKNRGKDAFARDARKILRLPPAPTKRDLDLVATYVATSRK